ncbi:MAG: sulfurtransferase TusA family protein [Candidatus Thermoplasmatota archaeon]|nr:sulfurtransferase TusA family protein [Candidatus Thermoplasmatota archaeon]MEC9353824.1 sulfurtransferase TusA family protein [Candidatus Thermoplasmatota archaeon]
MDRASPADGGGNLKEVDVRGLQCTQAVMSMLRALMPLPAGEELQVCWDTEDSKRDILTVIKRRNYTLISDSEEDGRKLLVVSK